MDTTTNLMRPITIKDLDVLFDIALESGPGFTSLPANRNLLAEKIRHSCSAMERDISSPKGESYLFVMEDAETDKVVGVCGIEAAVGLQLPFYHYRIGIVVHASRELEVHNTFETLYLCNDYTGCAEVCTLYLRPGARQNQNGSLLSKCRFMFMAQFKERFSKKVIAEMRGVSNDQGESPFWNGLGQHFFSMEFSQADYLTGTGNKVFIAELMPKHSIYIHLLPGSAKEVIGEVHDQTAPARKMLESEGFRYENYVDIFDGGPTLACKLDDIRAVRDSESLTALVQSDAPAAIINNRFLVSNTRLQEFRCLLVDASRDTGHIYLPERCLSQLHIRPGDQVRVAPLKP